MPLPAKFKIFSPNIFLSMAFAFAYICTAVPASAKEVSVFEIHRPIAMQNDEHPPKDIYINAGSNDGLKPGVELNVQRRQALFDMYKNKSTGDLIVVVGKIRIIHVQPDFSVARIVSLSSYDDTPAVDFNAIMVGDQVDLSSAHQASEKTQQKTAMVESAPSPVAVQLLMAPQAKPAPNLAPNLAPLTAGAASLSSMTP